MSSLGWIQLTLSYLTWAEDFNLLCCESFFLMVNQLLGRNELLFSENIRLWNSKRKFHGPSHRRRTCNQRIRSILTPLMSINLIDCSTDRLSSVNTMNQIHVLEAWINPCLNDKWLWMNPSSKWLSVNFISVKKMNRLIISRFLVLCFGNI